jgi:mono/diheme cytochrome c family protein
MNTHTFINRLLLAGALIHTPIATATDEASISTSKIDTTALTRTLRSVSVEDLVARKLNTGVYEGSPKVLANPDHYQSNYYNTLASNRGEPIPQYIPPPCDQAQPTEFDAEGCRIVNSLFTDVEDPTLQAEYRERVRRGRDVWHKGTFGGQDYFIQHVGNGIFGSPREPDQSHWLDTRNRDERYRKYGMINDPDCEAGDESSYWLDRCKDPHATGVIGIRKYYNTKPPEGFDPTSSPYEEGEIGLGKRFVTAQACAVCHTAFDPTNPPADANQPQWENLTGHIGNQYTNNTNQFFSSLPVDHFARILYETFPPGTVDTTSGHMDFRLNPGTQNNITDFQNRRVFEEQIKHPITGEVSKARTRHVLKGGEDSVGDKLSLLRVYLNIGLCFDECTADKFPHHGALTGPESEHHPVRIKACYQDCEPWNQADAKMDDLISYLVTGGPFYLKDATDIDGTQGASYINDSLVPEGRTVYSRECARCHSTKVPPGVISSDKNALEKFYQGHIFGRQQDWQTELGAYAKTDKFKANYLKEGSPLQFADESVFGQDWLGNDELTPHHEVGTNRCRSLHSNHMKGQVWEEFSSETYKARPHTGEIPRVVNPLIPLRGGSQSWFEGDENPGGGTGYYRNVSLLSIWAHAPFLHNNMLGNLRRLPDGSIDYTVKGRISMFEDAMARLLMSDDVNATPHRELKIPRVAMDTKLPTKIGGTPIIPVKAGSPVAEMGNTNPHSPLYMQCSDYVVNKGHQFGIDLSLQKKQALIEFLKTL